MLIRQHSEPHIVELENGSVWRIWPGDLASTLKWMRSVQFSNESGCRRWIAALTCSNP